MLDSAIIVKLFSIIWPIVAAPIAVIWKRQNDMSAQLQSTYSKDETKEQIELRQRPLEDALERNTKACEAMMKLLDEVRLDLAEARGNGKEKSGS